MQQKRCLAPFLVLLAMPMWSQTASAATADGIAGTVSTDISSFIGMKLDGLIARCGPPDLVYSSRGEQIWQDDVVFVYNEGDFYIFKDRVWQLGLKSAYGVTVGDSKPAVFLILGEEVSDHGEFLLLPLPPAGWPLMLRINFNDAGRVSAIFIYRPDF